METQGILTTKQDIDTYNRQNVYPITFYLKSTEPQTSSNYSHFFTCDSSYSVAEVVIVTSTSGAGSIQLEKLTSSQALGSGKNILLSNYSLSATANVPQYPLLSQSDSILLSRGDRIAVKTVTSPATVQNLLITVYLSKK
jgi:hypothetical protein